MDHTIKFSVEIQRSRRRTISLSVEKDLHVLVKVPLYLADSEVNAFVNRHSLWIQKHILLQQERMEKAPIFSKEQVAKLVKEAWAIAETGIQKYAQVMGVKPTGMKITSAVTRWGSCSGKNRICFSYRIALLPAEAVDYIIVHELAHIRQKNHGPHFYEEVSRILPDYKRRIALLKQAQRELGL
ncbi:MAG TPA: M48 family metallopeptidase [Caproicibacter sp.]|nr:M48 family metallopeptidase [Caproicibacter sp.]